MPRTVCECTTPLDENGHCPVCDRKLAKPHGRARSAESKANARELEARKQAHIGVYRGLESAHDSARRTAAIRRAQERR